MELNVSYCLEARPKNWNTREKPFTYRNHKKKAVTMCANREELFQGSDCPILDHWRNSIQNSSGSLHRKTAINTTHQVMDSA